MPFFSARTSLIIISPHYFIPAYKIDLSDAAGPRDSISNIYPSNKIYYHCVTCVGFYQCDKYVK
jgi:flagellar assembly factor FliW